MHETHPTAVVDPLARIGPGCRIGPFCVVGSDVELGEGVVLHSHAVVTGRTSIGAGTEIFPFSSIGHQPQDLKYAGEASRLVIGKNNRIREHVTMNPGTKGGEMLTRVGDSCLFMVGAHVAHDCQVGNGVIMANHATLAGHVVIEENVILGGLSAVQQFVRVGRNAMVGGMSGVERDVIPFGMVYGERATLQGINVVGLKRAGVAREEIMKTLRAYDDLFKQESGSFGDRIAHVADRFVDVVPVMSIVEFLRMDSSRRILHPKKQAQ